MGITRKSLADTIDAYDDKIADLQSSKRDTFQAYREQLSDLMGKDEVKVEIEAAKAAIKRRRAIREKGEEVVDHKDALVDEIFLEISGTHAPRATRVENIEQFDAETGEIIEPNSAPAETPPPSAMAERATGTPSDGLHDAGEGMPLTSPADIQPETAAQTELTVENQSGRFTSPSEREAVESSEPHSPAGEVAADKSGEASVASPAPPAKKRWTFNDPAHRDCLDPGQCGGFSNLKLCERCRLAAAADVHLEAAE